LRRRLEEEGAGDVVLLVGGTVPAGDVPALREMGYGVFGTGSRLADIVAYVREEVGRRRGGCRPARVGRGRPGGGGGGCRRCGRWRPAPGARRPTCTTTTGASTTSSCSSCGGRWTCTWPGCARRWPSTTTRSRSSGTC